ncbi:MAG: response regulator [Myxococcota bacterium]
MASTVRRFLVIDDEVVALKIARERLERSGYEVITHEGGFGSSQVALRAEPDAVLLDVKMPALGGEQIVGLLRKYLGEDVPIILHSSETLAELDSRAARLGVLGGIPKSSDDALFDLQLSRLIRRANTTA